MKTTSTDVELEQQLKEVGNQLAHPPDSVDELLRVLDQVAKLLLKVDQSPKNSILKALKPSMNALIHDRLSKHSDIDVKVAVAYCISEITRITAPHAPYNDDQMRDMFQLFVYSFENLADQSSRSYNKRASILDTVSRVRSCVIMLDLGCDELIVKMFEHFLKSVRDYHRHSIVSSMENIMAMVIGESEEISVEMLKPLLASVKKDHERVLPVAHKLGKAVLLKSADKLRPYMILALTSLGESLDMYHKVVAAVCEGTTAIFENNGDNDSGLQLANECKLEKGSVDEAHQVAKEEVCVEEVDPTVENKSPKSVMSNGVNVTVKEEASVDQESKKPEKDRSQEPLGKEDTDDSDADKLVKEKSKTEKTSKRSEKKADIVINSAEPFDKENDNDVNELENQNEEDNDVKETEKDKDLIQEFSPKAIESKPAATANVFSLSHSNNDPDGSSVRSKQKPVPQEDETPSLSKSVSLPDKTRMKKVGLPKNKGLTQEETPEAQNQAGKKTLISKEVKLPDTVNKSEDGVASSDPDAELLKKSSKSTKRKLPDIVNQSEDGEASRDSDAKLLRKSSRSTKQKLPETVKKSEEGKASSDSDAKLLKELSKSTKQSGKKSKQSGKRLDVGEPDAKKANQSVKKVDVKGEESDSNAKPPKMSVKKGEKSKIAAEEEEQHDSVNKPLKLSAKKSTSKKKDDGKKRGNGKNVAENDQAKSLSGDNEMDISPKSATKSAKGEGNSTETPVTSAKRKHDTGKDEVTIKYDESLIGTKVKVWWPADKMYYEGVVERYYPDKKMHKISYVDGDRERLDLREHRWEILQGFSIRDVEGQKTEARSEEASPEIHKKKKSKTHPSMSQEKNKDSANKVQKAMTKTYKPSRLGPPTCILRHIATDNPEHGLRFTLDGGLTIWQPPQEEHTQHESQQQPQCQPHHQRFAVRHPSLPPRLEDVLHDHTRRLQHMEDLLQWSVKLQIERARADGFPIPPLPSPRKDPPQDPPL